MKKEEFTPAEIYMLQIGSEYLHAQVEEWLMWLAPCAVQELMSSNRLNIEGIEISPSMKGYSLLQEMCKDLRRTFSNEEIYEAFLLIGGEHMSKKADLRRDLKERP